MIAAVDLDALKQQLTVDEARKYTLYDDATGKRITQGSVVKGHPTWGIGFNCDALDFTDAAIDAQFDDVLTRTINEVVQACPWVQMLPSGPFRVVIDIAYNAGVNGLLEFHRMLLAAQKGDYPTAAQEVLTSQLAPARKQRLADLMRTA